MSGQIVAITAGKGGVGKTMVTVTLGALLAAQGKTVLLVDMNMGMRGLDIALGLEDRVVFDLGDVLEGLCERSAAIIRDRETKVHLLAARQMAGKETVEEEGLLAMLESLRAEYDYILLDTPPAGGPAFDIAARAAETALILATPDDAALRAADRVSGLLRRADVRDQWLVINRISAEHVDAGRQYPPDVCAQIIDMKVLGALPEAMEAARLTLEKRPVLGKSDVAEGFVNLAERLMHPALPLRPWREEAQTLPETKRRPFDRFRWRHAPRREVL